ncbi:MAG TPA: ABC transporter ATP-binding protein [Candidatus Binatia bacterium]|nr:ABC transporter ATP-binding protein [Candidatus Binatia bacterium]
MALLSVRDLTVQFGGLRAVDGFSTDVEAGRIHSLIGPNGAGKSTVINAVTGLYPVRAGSIRLAGEELAGLPPHQIAARGVTRTFQNVELFGEMTVLDNVLVGAHLRLGYGVLGATLRAGSGWRTEGREVQRAEQILETVGLADDRRRQARDLPFAKQRRLELARALAAEPRLLLLDEPAAGMTAAEVAGLNKVLVGLRERQGLTVVLVDHVMQVVMEISDVITVLHYGRKIAEGPAHVVRSDAEVVRAYLGERRARC